MCQFRPLHVWHVILVKDFSITCKHGSKPDLDSLASLCVRATFGALLYFKNLCSRYAFSNWPRHISEILTKKFEGLLSAFSLGRPAPRVPMLKKLVAEKTVACQSDQFISAAVTFCLKVP